MPTSEELRERLQSHGYGGAHMHVEREDELREQRLAMSQAIYLALQCDECSIGGEHRAMLEKHARVYERAVAEQEREA